MSEEKTKEELAEDILEGAIEEMDPPSEEEFTRAIETLSETDRHLFEDTGVIHIDRNMPAETQAMHVISLHKQRTQKRNRVYVFIQTLLVAGVIMSAAGLFLNRMIEKEKQNRTAASVVEEGVKSDTPALAIDEAAFPDALLRNYVSSNFDTNADGMLTAEERNAVLVMLVPEDTAVTNLTGIEQFPLLETLTAKNTSVASVDLSTNEKLSYIDVSATLITELDLSRNPNVTKINVDDTQITSLILPKDSKVIEIDAKNTNLECEKDESGIYHACTLKAAEASEPESAETTETTEEIPAE